MSNMTEQSSKSNKHYLQQERTVVIIFSLLVVIFLAVFAYFNFQRELASRTTVPKTAPLSISFGKESAPAKVIVYTDPVCDKCIEYHQDTLKPLYDEYVKTGKAQLEIRPIGIVSVQSAPLVRLTMCGNDQDKYWQTAKFINDALTRKNQKDVAINASMFFSDFKVSEIAKITEMDQSTLDNCLGDTKYLTLTEEADRRAYAANINSTPATFIGDQEAIRGYSIYEFVKSRVELEL